MEVRGDLWSTEDYRSVLDRVKGKLWLYIQNSARIKGLERAVEDFTLLDTGDLDHLAAIHFLLTDDIKEFLMVVVPRILRRISHSTKEEVIVNRNQVKGRIDWGATTKERCTQGMDPTIFVCKPPYRIYDLPENQLLKIVLEKTRKLIEESKSLPKVEEKEIVLDDLKTGEGQKWEDRVALLRFNVSKLLKHIYMREIDIPPVVNERMLKRARTSRNKDYEWVEKLYDQYDRLIQKREESLLKELLERRVLEPWSRDTLYEVYVLLEIIDAFLNMTKEVDLRLIWSKANEVAKFNINDQSVKVYYQRGLFEESKYKDIFERYDLNVASRRPDIIIEFENGNGKRYWLVEVKRTINREYIVDGAYKVLGYLADFEDYFDDKDQRPKAALVVWHIDRKGEGEEQDITILSKDDIREFARQIAS